MSKRVPRGKGAAGFFFIVLEDVVVEEEGVGFLEGPALVVVSVSLSPPFRLFLILALSLAAVRGWKKLRRIAADDARASWLGPSPVCDAPHRPECLRSHSNDRHRKRVSSVVLRKRRASLATGIPLTSVSSL